MEREGIGPCGVNPQAQQRRRSRGEAAEEAQQRRDSRGEAAEEGQQRRGSRGEEQRRHRGGAEAAEVGRKEAEEERQG